MNGWASSQFILLSLAMLVVAGPAFAQPRLFVSGSAFADIKRFSGYPSTNTLDGTAVGGGARVGGFLSEHWTVEGGLDAAFAAVTDVQYAIRKPN